MGSQSEGASSARFLASLYRIRAWVCPLRLGTLGTDLPSTRASELAGPGTQAGLRWTAELRLFPGWFSGDASYCGTFFGVQQQLVVNAGAGRHRHACRVTTAGKNELRWDGRCTDR